MKQGKIQEKWQKKLQEKELTVASRVASKKMRIANIFKVFKNAFLVTGRGKMKNPGASSWVLRWIGNLLYWPGPYPKPKTLKCNFWVVMFRSKLRSMDPGLSIKISRIFPGGQAAKKARYIYYCSDNSMLIYARRAAKGKTSRALIGG